MNMTRSSVVWTVMLSALLLGGCVDRSLVDLQRFVEKTGQAKPKEIEPLPAIKPVENFTYTATDFADPFASGNLRPRRVVQTQSGTGPDTNRRREPLENFPLDSLKMVGTLFRENERRVIIKTPNGAVTTARVGNYGGQNYGQIKSISEEAVEVSEQVLTSSGVWVERDATIKVIR